MEKVIYWVKKIGRIANWLLLPILVGVVIVLQLKMAELNVTLTQILAQQHGIMHNKVIEICTPRAF
jgi:hypothetical protein